MPSERTPKYVDPRAITDEPREGYVEITVKKRRSSQQNRRYWAILRAVVDATECLPSAAHLHDAIKVDLGYTTPVYRMDGSVFFVPNSCAFDRMDQDEFNHFKDRAMALIAMYFLKHMTPDEVERIVG